MSVKLQTLQEELSLAERELRQFLQTAGITVPEGVKRIPEKDAARLRGLVRDTRRREEKRKETIRLPSILSARALAEKLGLPAGDIMKALLKNGVVTTLNEDMDYDTAAIIASDLGYTTEEDVTALEEDILTPEKLEEILAKEDPKRQRPRPPVVTIMGHVDHGKTTLLSSIRESEFPEEAGGITQQISSYQVQKKDKAITFIDTPGHEAFKFMRKRGASLADIAILVVAADDGVKEQTKEAARHAKEAGVPIVVAITKVDTPGADPDRVKRQLADIELLPEAYGGETPVVAVSVPKNIGLDDLLETVLLVADLAPPTAVEDRPALATVIESRRDPQMGILTSVLIHAGTLRRGDSVVVGKTAGTVRQLLDFHGRPIRKAGPSAPVTIVGLEGLPNAGDILQVVEERVAARKKAKRVARVRAATHGAGRAMRAKKDAAEEDESEKGRTLTLILKADTQGSLEAIQQTIQAMGTADVRARFLRAGVGNITESDILTAEAAEGIVIGFNVDTAPAAAHLADTHAVPIQSSRVIYDLTEDIRKRLEALLPPEVVRTTLGKLTVLKIFFTIRGRQILGGRVTSGVVKPGERMEAFRGETRVARGTITEIQKNRVRVDTARAGEECGVTVEGEGRVKEGDAVVIFHEEVRRRRLDDAAPRKGPEGRR